MIPSDYVEFNDLSSNGDTQWFKMWANALRPKFRMQQDLYWQTGQEKPVAAIGKLFSECLEVSLNAFKQIITMDLGM